MKSEIKTKLLLSLSGSGVFIVFHKVFEDVISETFVKHVFSQAQSNLVNDIIIGISTGIIISWIVRKISARPVISPNVLVIWICIIGLYSWYRFSESPWTFTSLFAFSGVKYLDLIYIPGAFYILLFFFNGRNHSSDAASGFIEDLPLEENEPDILKYENYCKQIAEKINNSTFRKSFAIGVTGEWGSGKTSFMHLIKRNLKHQIIFDFNPWSSQNPAGITLDFFNTLSRHLSPLHSSVSKELLEYGNSLIAGFNNDFISSFKVFNKQTSISERYELINGILKKVGKQVVVFIDDVDRLDEVEVQEVVKLIRNTANFYNVVFIVGYDRNYLIKSVSKINKHRSEFFLEKIFQLEISLPHFESKIIRQKLIELLIKGLGEDMRSEIEELVKEARFLSDNILDKFIVTIRDVNRLVNSTVLDFVPIKGEVLFSELFYLEILKMKFPSVYELIHRKQSEFFEPKQEGFNRYAFKLKAIQVQNRVQDLSLESYLNTHKDQLSIDAIHIGQVIDLIKILFPSSPVYSKKERHLSIRYPSNFSKYFAMRLLDGDLSEIDFVNARNSSQQDFNAYISTIVSKGLGWSLRDRFEEIRFFDSREDFEKVINGIFHLARQRGKTPFGEDRTLGYSGEDLYDKLYNKDNRLRNKFFGTDESLKDFVLSNFKNASRPYLVEGSIVKDLTNRTFLEDFPLSQEELESIVIEYFDEYLKGEKEFTATVWWLYNNCHFKKYNLNGGTYYSEEYIIPRAKELFVNFVKQHDPKIFLESIIDYDVANGDQLFISHRVEQLFESWDSFYQYLESFNEEEFGYIKEYKQFFLALKEKNFKERVKFNFAHFESKISKK